MIPSLATRGKLVLACGASFVIVGAIHAAAPLVALGSVVLCAVLTAYLWFFPTAVLLRRRKIELSWWVPPGDQPGGALAVDRPFSLHVALRNHGMRRLRVLDLGIFASSALDVPVGLEANVAPGMQVELRGDVRARSAGYWVLHGAVISFGDALGLFDVRAYFPNPIAIKVFPRQAALRGQSALRMRTGPSHERVGPHQLRRRGMAGELREIRDYSYGDPFKFIAWKSSARQRKLMVRDLETEIVLTHQLLVDIGSGMREGARGATRLDYAVETAAAIAHAALDGGDRVGLVTFDARVYSQLRPADGYHHYLKVIDRLLETHNVVDEDLTDLTNGELVAAVARYLAHQEAVDVRLSRAPALDDPAWEKIHAGPSGELYDLSALGTVVSSLLKSMGQTAAKGLAPAWWWSRVHIGADADPQMAKLRLFARLRGIELPYRRAADPSVRARGFAAALDAAMQAGRADVVVVISDLGGVAERPDVALRPLARMRKSGVQVVAVTPFGPAFESEPVTHTGERVAAALEAAERARIDAARAALARHGLPVIEAGPRDSAALLARRLARARSALRRVA